MYGGSLKTESRHNDTQTSFDHAGNTTVDLVAVRQLM